jgi:hypothetical protein
MKTPTIHQILDIAGAVSVGCSVVANLLPNAKFLDAYPRAQKAYNAVIAFIAALAVNIRHCLPSLDVAAPSLGITKPLPTEPK